MKKLESNRRLSCLTTLVGGFAAFFLVLLVSTSAFAQTETVLYNFTGQEGANPLASLVFDPAGNLYGTASSGGERLNGCSSGGCGAVFQLSPSSSGIWNESVLHFFRGHSGGDGANPECGLVFDVRGNLYGTTPGGAGFTNTGTAFELSPSGGGVWNERLIHAFSIKSDSDGDLPFAGLVADAAGNTYGTTRGGGGISGSGTVFELTRTTQGQKEIVLYSFSGGRDGADPLAGLVFGAAGKLYGTTARGGDVSKCSALGQPGCGVVFELSPTSSGWQQTVLHTFSGGNDGGASESNLIFDAAGNLYGTTTYGGATACLSSGNGCGVVFELSPNSSGGWDETVLHTFTGPDGAFPTAGVVLDSAGNLYGTTLRGGIITGCAGDGCGVVFKLSAVSGGGWTETVLHKFGATGHDGTLPQGGLIFDAAGNLYGTTRGGGTNGIGTVFKITQ
jgi:uncharacterized repeat protein (TIGR03803 family)